MTEERDQVRNLGVPPREARALQETLRGKLVMQPPADFAPRLFAGLDMSITRFAKRGYAGIVTIDRETMQDVEQASAAVDVAFPYVPGLLSFRELPALAAAWERLRTTPHVLVFDGHGYAHPRRFGLACHGGMLFGVPSVGCAKRLLIGTHAPLGAEAGATAEIVHDGEVIGVALRTRRGVKPVYVSIGHRMDLPTAVRVVQRMCAGYREPETTRRAHRLVNAARKADLHG